MSEQQKIWFIYLTDHHEGPFTPAEVAEKVSQGAVTPQSLGWKDGMAEWLAIEAIPELKAALGDGGASASAANDAPAIADIAEPAAAGEAGFSLAQLLAEQQGGGGVPPVDSGEPAPIDFGSGANPLSSLVTPPGASSDGSGLSSLQLSGATKVNIAAVSPSEEVWTMRVGAQVSGLHSVVKLKELAAQGDVPADAHFWRPGWTDFQPITAIPELNSARRSGTKKASSQTNPQITRGSGTKSGIIRSGIAPLTAGANLGTDDPTDPGIQAGATKQGLLQKIMGVFRRAPKNSAPARSGTRSTVVKGSKLGGAADAVKRVALGAGGLLLVAGGGAAYFFLFASPIPSDLDVLPEDLEAMKIVLKSPTPRLYLAESKGTPEEPPDLMAPKFYVASSLPEGTTITLAITGKPGTLLNRVTFAKSFTSVVGPKRLAVFNKLDDDGKPLPTGEYEVKVTGEGAEALVTPRFLGGRKSGPYQDRLKKYQDKIQADYDKEVGEITELTGTIKSVHVDLARKIVDYKQGWSVAGNRPRIANEWGTFSASAQAILGQLANKLKTRAPTDGLTFYPRAFQDISATVGQLEQLMAAHKLKLTNESAPATDDLEGTLNVGVSALEEFIAQARTQKPFEVLTGGGDLAPRAAPAPKP